MPTRIYGPKQRYIKPPEHYQLSAAEKQRIEQILNERGRNPMEYQSTFRYSEEDKARLLTIMECYGLNESEALRLALRQLAAQLPA